MIDIKQALAKANEIEQRMNLVVVQQPRLVRALWLSVLSRSHLIAAGEAGIAKTFTVDVFMSHVTDVKKFYAMCFKAMDHQVLIGNLSPKRLIEDDELVYNITGKMPDCEIVVLDEGLKNNAVNLNIMLPILNERKFMTNGHLHVCPLWTCVLTSNMDEFRVTGELAAFHDRFAARMVIEPVNTDDGFRQILAGQVERFSQAVVLPPPPLTIDRTEIEALQQATREVTHPPAVIEALVDLRRRAEVEGLRPSARRFGQFMNLMAAQACWNGRPETQLTDLTLGQDVLWTEPDGRAAAYKLIVQYAGEAVSRAYKVRTELLEPLVVSVNTLERSIGELRADNPDADLPSEHYKTLARLRGDGKRIDAEIGKALKEAGASGEDASDLLTVQRELAEVIAVVNNHMAI